MFEKSWLQIKSLKDKHTFVLVGAGKYGQILAGRLIDEEAGILCFFDNDDKKKGIEIYGIPVMEPKKIEDESVLYIITVDNDYARYQLKKSLLRVGIPEQKIKSYFPHRCLDYHATLQENEYKEAIDEMYKDQVGKTMDWYNPHTYNEIMCWEKLNLKDERYANLADKNKVRKWVAQKIGEEHLTKQFGVWQSSDDVNIEVLPEAFVLKVNNGSGRNIIVKNKKELNWTASKELLDYWMSSNYKFGSFDMFYGEIEPCIIAEEYLDGLAESLYDYHVLCFHDEPKYVCCLKGSHRENSAAAYYDLDWNKQPFSFGWPLDIYPAPKPERLEELLHLSKILCKGFRHVRVDWYIMPDGRILFGEMTFRTWGGMKRFIPDKYDEVLGRLI